MLVLGTIRGANSVLQQMIRFCKHPIRERELMPNMVLDPD